MLSDNLPIVKDLPSPQGRWELVEVIGEGNYGEVFKARSIETGEMAAVKVMEAVLDKEEDIKAELNVFENHSHHPNIVSFYGAFVKKDPIADDQLWIVMEYCNGGSVTDLVKHMKEKGESLPEDLISYILREVLEGLSYLHSVHVIHRDIKGQNVLLTNTARVKLIDFGISAVVDKTLGRRRTTIGTPYWMAPEVIACEQQMDYDYDARADVWSLGITAIEIADSTPPLFGENPMRALFRIPKNKPPVLQSPARWSRQFNDFIAKCLCKDFEKRSTSRELLAHTFVNFVPKDPKLLRRGLMTLIDVYQHGEPLDIFPDSSTSTSGADTTRRNLKALKTCEIVDDLASLEYIDESVIVSQLCKRYQKRLVYTYVGDILVSINPFQKLDIYSEKHSQLHCAATRGQLPPHIFAVAGSAYQAMVQENRDQCCVVSGESGAGKTEASNILVQQFMKLGRAETKSLEEKILKVNPLMESFGNARTVINDNSSRFGKYLELHFTLDGHIVGAHLSEYLLEKSRVVSQARRERNFHIFYYLLAGLGTRHQLAKYNLKGYHHRYLEHRGTVKGSAKRNAIFSERFDLIENAFYLFGFSKQEFESVCGILAAILNIGDVRLETDFHSHIGEVSTISNRDLIDDVASLLQIKPEKFEKALTTSQVVTYGETIVRPNTIEQAIDVRDAMAKALYGRLFSWIVNKINPELNPPSSHLWKNSVILLLKYFDDFTGEMIVVMPRRFTEKVTRVVNVGILDIFGFENFRSNSFEQLCINIANEQLQFYFNQHIFAWEQEEYEREGIDVRQVGYQDNRPLLELLLNRPMGLLALLDEESKFPRASDLSLAAKFHDNFHASTYYKKPKDRGPTFTVLHYAGPVTYETAGFLEKNRDTLRADVAHLLKMSHSSIVRSLFYTPLSRTGSLSSAPMASKVPPSATPLFSRRAPIIRGHHHFQSQPTRPSGSHGHTPLSSSGTITSNRAQTVSTYFINSLRELMAKMLAGTPHFVRCIRPNELKSPDQFQADKVLVQLRYTGVLETTRIRKEGYSHRILFEDFVHRYKVISYPLSKLVKATPANCVQILMQAGLKNWALGKTKIFLKYYHVERLVQILNSYDRSAIAIQCVLRGWMARRRVARLREERRMIAVVRIQAAVRGFLARCRYQRLQLHREEAALTIQTAVRVWLARSNFLTMLQKRQVAAIKIQAVVRMWLCKQKLLKVRYLREEMAVRIQRAVRMWLCRQQQLNMKHHREEMVIRIQSAVRMWLCKRQLVRMKLHREEMVIRIQRAVRRWLSRQWLEDARKDREREGTGSLRWRLHRRAMASVKLLEEQLHRDQDHVVRERSARIIQNAYQRRRSYRQSQREVEEMRRKASEERREVAMFLRQMESEGLDQFNRLQLTAAKGPFPRPVVVPSPRLQRTSSPKVQRKKLHGQVIRHGDRVIWRPSVLTYYEESKETHQPPSHPPSHSHQQPSHPPSCSHQPPSHPPSRSHQPPSHPPSRSHQPPSHPPSRSHQPPSHPPSRSHQPPSHPPSHSHQPPSHPPSSSHQPPSHPPSSSHQPPSHPPTSSHQPPSHPPSSSHQPPSHPPSSSHQPPSHPPSRSHQPPSHPPSRSHQPPSHPPSRSHQPPSHPPSSSSQTQHTKRIFEELIARQTQEALRDSPVTRRQKLGSIKNSGLLQGRPDTVFQKLLERFDPMRLTGATKTRVK